MFLHWASQVTCLHLTMLRTTSKDVVWNICGTTTGTVKNCNKLELLCFDYMQQNIAHLWLGAIKNCITITFKRIHSVPSFQHIRGMHSRSAFLFVSPHFLISLLSFPDRLDYRGQRGRMRKRKQENRQKAGHQSRSGRWAYIVQLGLKVRQILWPPVNVLPWY